MEAAGSSVADVVLKKVGVAAGSSAGDLSAFQERPVVVFCGPGANGGDGFVVARKLKTAGVGVRVGLLGDRAALMGDAAMMADLYEGEVERLDQLAPEALGAFCQNGSVFIDALFGAGLSRPLEGAAKTIVEIMNAAPQPTIAVDLPSGIAVNTGAVLGVGVQAAATVTFIARKPAHLLYPGRAFCGEIHVAEIGVEDRHLNTALSGDPGTGATTATKPMVENGPAIWGARFPRPRFDSHKYARGGALIVSGPAYRTGAARLAARGALRVGAGAVTLACDHGAAPEIAANITAIMMRLCENAAALSTLLNDPRYRVCVIGPGAGVEGNSAEATRAKTLAALASETACVLDADALTSFEAMPDTLFAAIRPSDVLTPHAGEFQRLFGDAIKNAVSKPDAVLMAARAAGGVVLLKGADTVIAAPDGRIAINTNAPSDLATAGAGDVLAGFIGGLLAQGAPAFEAACAGVWLHGACGQAAGPGLIADDLPEMLPQVLRRLLTPHQGRANETEIAEKETPQT